MEIPAGSSLRTVSILVGKGLALLLLGLVNNLPNIGYLDQPR